MPDSPGSGGRKLDFETYEVEPPRSKGLKLDWKCYEELATTNNTFDYSNRAHETDEADKFKHRQGVKVEQENRDRIFPVLRVLKHLWGKPWDNLDLDVVTGLKPSCIRASSGAVTCDSMPGRITVWLEKDDRTIRSIEFETSTWAIGVKSGEDLAHKANGIPLPPPSDDPYVHVNNEAIKKINFG